MALKTTVDVLVIGAGPSGTVAASILNKAGFQVQIVEKMKFPRFVIGESLLPRCMEALDEAGFIEAIQAKNFQKKVGAKFVRGEEICSFTFDQQYTEGWNWTWQVTRADFDKTLADECERMGVHIAYETEVIDIKINADESSLTTVRLNDGTEHQIAARFIVDGSGYGRVIPRLFGLDKPSTQYKRKAIFSHMEDPKRAMAHEPNRIIAVVHNPRTWIWIIPFSNGNTSVGYVGDPEFFDQYPGDLTEKYRQLIAADPQLAVRFKEMKLVWDEPRLLQGWSASVDKFYGKGFVLTGNVTEFLDPIFSSGVTLATVSAQTAAKLVIRKLRGEEVDFEQDYMQFMQRGVDVFRTYVDRWYDGTLYTIFFSKKRSDEIMNQICSVLAGYVWDETNPFVAKHEKAVQQVARFLEATS